MSTVSVTRTHIILAALLATVACSPSDDERHDDDGGDRTASPFVGKTVQVLVDGQRTDVDLGLIDHIPFGEQDAIRLTRIIEMAAIESPWSYQYGFESNDGWNVLSDRLDGDPSSLPYYGELSHGFVVDCQDDGDGLCLAWDDDIEVPRFLNVKGIDGGVIESVAIPEGSLLVVAGDTRAVVDLTTMDAVEYVDTAADGDAAVQAIPFGTVLEAAGLVDPAAYAYKMVGDDGWSNNDNNLMPYENSTHSYIQSDTRRVLTEEDWDTDECCWRVRDTVLILGISLSE